jgi:uncharacterized protein
LVSSWLAVNSSPLILLGKVARLDLLTALAERVVVPQAVILELNAKTGQDWLGRAVMSHPGIELADDLPIPEHVDRWNLGAGEAAVLAFCLANSGFRAVLDDLRGRRCAQACAIPLFGTLGVIVEARKRQLIPAARPLLEAIRAAGYYIDEPLVAAALRQVGEDRAKE